MPFKLRLASGFVVLGLAFSSQILGRDLPGNGGAALIEAENKVTVKAGEHPWQKGVPEMPLAVGNMVQTGERSRAAMRMSDASVARLDELTRAQIIPPKNGASKSGVNLADGALYFFSREKAREMEVLTPAVAGALRGTEFVVRVFKGGRTQVTMMDGEVELSNAAGSVVLRSGEQGEAEVGGAPHKTAVIEAKNIIQWALYYPGVLDPAELGMSPGEGRSVGESLQAYQRGDLLGALEKYPSDLSPGSEGGRLYRAGVLLAVGRVDAARKAMQEVPIGSPGRRALERMIAAVNFQVSPEAGAPQTAGEWMAESYYRQSRGDLEGARVAAIHATERKPELGYAWVRLAELEFCFGRIPRAKKALERGLALTPDNAQAHSLMGFLLCANNSIGKGRESFEKAIQLDGALGNAWLGRGLTFIRQGREEPGQRDMQAACVLEPNRSIFHSYLGKAFSAVGNVKIAGRDLGRAKEIDPDDPTPWLYSAIENKQENRYNQAVEDLEKSVELNDNRRLYRSRFLLDQDRSIRSTNLAAIFLNDGMREQSVREAVRAVDADYSSAPAHLFLANSYNALRDPTRVLLRYESPWLNELLLSNLLSPVGGGPLSQFVSEEEFSKMFEHDGLGIFSSTDYLSNGQLREVGSQYGTSGNLSYALDAEYFHSDGERANNWINRFEGYATFKLQLTPQDILFFQTKFEKLGSGDVLQRFDQSEVDRNLAARTTHFTETQDPGLLLLGYHHEWSPGNHTLVLAGRLANRQELSAEDARQSVFTRDVSAMTAGQPYEAADFSQPFNDPKIYRTLRELVGQGPIQWLFPLPFDLSYRPSFEIYSAEIQQIFTLGPDTLLLGGRYQNGEFETMATLENREPYFANLFDTPSADQNMSVGMDRVSLYAYNTLRLTSWLSLTGGVTYERLEYPDNFRNPPVNDGQQLIEKVLPKAGFVLQPTRSTVLRGCYAEALSGASFDESVTLEPTQVAGFTQVFRTLASESLLGSVAGSRYQIFGLSLEQKLPTRTFLGIGFDQREQKIDRTVGVFDFLQSGGYPSEILPSSLPLRNRYKERVLSANLNQLLGERWSLGTRYSYIQSELGQQVPALQEASKHAPSYAVASLSRASESHLDSALHEVGLFALYNHPSGFFAQGEANWFSQSNRYFAIPEPGDDFWQFNLYGGYRFHRNQCEVACGVLNLGGSDYRLEPLTPYAELPRCRTFVVHVKIAF